MRRPSRQGLAPLCSERTPGTSPACYPLTTKKNPVPLLVLVICALPLLIRCYTDEDIQPEVKITFITPDTRSLMIDITVGTFGSNPVADFGIVYRETPGPDINGARMSIPGERKRRNTCTIDGLRINTTYYVRAYIILTDSTVTYSNEVTSQTLLHKLLTFHPKTATIHDEVTVIGKNFVPHHTQLFLDDVHVQAEVTTDTIRFFPPPGLPTDNVRISVEIDGTKLTFGLPLNYRNGRWTQLASLKDTSEPPKDIGFGVFGLGIGTGIYSLNTIDHFNPNVVRRYDPGTQTWSDISHYPGNDHPIYQWFALDEQIFVLGEDRALFEFNVGSHEWHRHADLPFEDIFMGTAFALGGYGYAGLGTQEDKYMTNLWRFNPLTGTWHHASDFPSGATSGVLTLVHDGSVFFFGGMEWLPDQLRYTREVWCYDPDGNTWERRTDYPGAGSINLNGVSMNGKIYIGGGGVKFMNNDVMRDFWEYDPETDRWTQLADMPAARELMYASNIWNTAYFGGGKRSSTRWSFEVWKFETQ